MILLIDEIVTQHNAWNIVQQTRGGIGQRLKYSPTFMDTDRFGDSFRRFEQSFSGAETCHQHHLLIVAAIKKPLKVAWEIGLRGILSHETIDYFTATKDFSSDILTRAQFFAQNGY